MLQCKWAFIFLIAFSISACTDNRGPAGKIWFYTHSSGAAAPEKTNLTPASFLDLEKDGSYSSDFGAFDYGKWIYKNHELVLTDYQNKQAVFPIDYLTATEMLMGPPKGPFNNFESQPHSFSSLAENPFSKDNNQWRIKAIDKEDTKQVKKRLLNHFRFWEMYFSWALKSSIQYIDVRSTPSPIKIYGNGFTLQPYNELSAIWKSYFYDEEDCRVASDKIKYVIDHGLIAWPHTDNRYKMFIGVFQQLQQTLP